MRIFKNAWFERFARKERLDDKVLCSAVTRAEKGLIDADLGSGVIKQRIARQGKGKSGGYRSIIVFRKGDRAFFIHGFAKSDFKKMKSKPSRKQQKRYWNYPTSKLQNLLIKSA